MAVEIFLKQFHFRTRGADLEVCGEFRRNRIGRDDSPVKWIEGRARRRRRRGADPSHGTVDSGGARNIGRNAERIEVCGRRRAGSED